MQKVVQLSQTELFFSLKLYLLFLFCELNWEILEGKHASFLVLSHLPFHLREKSTGPREKKAQS